MAGLRNYKSLIKFQASSLIAQSWHGTYVVTKL